MRELLNLMVRLPFTMLSGGASVFLRSAQEMELAISRAIDEFSEGDAQQPLPSPLLQPNDDTSYQLPIDHQENHINRSEDLDKERVDMHEYDDHVRRDSQDLSGDELKFVSYSIIFTKRDFEATLQAEREEIVDYDTDGGAFGALKLSEYFEELRSGKAIPREWGSQSRGRPSPATGYGFKDDKYSRIPCEDRKYIRFVYSVMKRVKKSTNEYERDQRDAQRQIADSIGRIADSL